MTYVLHTVTAETANGTPLQVVSAEIGLDDTWSPFLRGTLEVVTPANVALLDPRIAGNQLTVTMTAQYGPEMQFTSDLTSHYSGTVAALTALFGGKLTSDVLAGFDRTWEATYREPSSRVIRCRPRRRLIQGTGTTVLQVASDEALLYDLRAFYTGQTYPGPTLRTVITALFADLTEDTPYTFTLDPGPDDVVLPLITEYTGGPQTQFARTEAGQTYWDFLAGFLQMADLRLWCDPQSGHFRLGKNGVNPTPGAAAVFSTGNGGNVVSAGEEIDKDSDLWADAVVIDYLPNPADPGALHSSVALGAALYSKVMLEDVNAISPVNQFSAEPGRAAGLMVQRAMKRGRIIPVDALSDYSIEPGRTANLNIPISVPATGTVQAVTWQIPEWEMTVTTRNLE